MNNLKFLAVLFLLSGHILSGQEVKISGSGKGYSGAELKIFSLTDPVTKTLKPVKRVKCDDKGSFLFTVPVNRTNTIYIKAGAYTYYIYATAGKDYRLSFADYIPRPAGEEFNPFFEEIKMMPEVVSDSSDINNLIRKFDAEYDPAFNRIADRVAFNIKRSDIPAIVERLNKLSAPGMPPFFSDFVRFRMIMINMVGSGEYAGRVEDSVMINREFVPENPAYLDLIEQRFSGYFTTILNGPYRNDFIKAIASSSLTDLKRVILLSGGAANEQLREYIILINLHPAYFDGSVPAPNVTALMSGLASSGSTPYIRELASTVLERTLALSPGSNAPEFDLKDQGGNSKSIGSFRGKYVLLTITRSDNPATIAEYTILNSWYKKYSADLQVVTILADTDFTQALARMKSAGFGWTMLDGSMKDIVEYDYNVKIYPCFVLIGRDGRIITGNCPFPSENLEKIIAVKLAPQMQ